MLRPNLMSVIGMTVSLKSCGGAVEIAPFEAKGIGEATCAIEGVTRKKLTMKIGTRSRSIRIHHDSQ